MGDEMIVRDAAPVPAAGSVVDADLSFAVGEQVGIVMNPGGVHAESIRVLRTQLLGQHFGLGRRGLAMVSPSGDNGCTSTAVNLGVAIAQTGAKTLLIDADLQSPRVHELIVPSRPLPGLRQLLSDADTKLFDVVQEDVLPNFSVLFAGGATDRSQELIAGARFRAVVDQAIRDWDVVLIDTPPANVSADARQIGQLVDYVLMVVGRDHSYVADVEALVRELKSDGSHIVGVALIES